MNSKISLTIAALILATNTIPAVANHKTTPYPGRPQVSNDAVANDYRHKAHKQLEMQMRQQVNTNPQYRNLPQSEKERIIRNEHQRLDRQLDQREEQWRENNRDNNRNNNRDYRRNNDNWRNNDRRNNDNWRNNDPRYNDPRYNDNWRNNYPDNNDNWRDDDNWNNNRNYPNY